MPYATNSVLPDNIKKLDKKKQTAWRKAFNAAFKEYGDEEAAFKVANSMLKKMTESVDGSEENRINFGAVNLSEATLDDTNRRIELVALSSGWSKNGYYYSPKVVESLSDFLLESKKIYVNHVNRPVGNQKYLGGRDMRDWAAQVQEAYGKDGKCHAKVHVFEEPDGWLYERAKLFPGDVGLSIDAQAIVEMGKAEGREGKIVTKFLKLNSVDFVQEASAGGFVVGLTESDISEIESEKDEILSEISELKNENIKQVIENFINELENRSSDVQNRSINLKDFILELVSEISRTEYVPVEYPAEAYIYAPNEKKPHTWLFRYKDYDDKGVLEIDKHLLCQSADQFKWYMNDQNEYYGFTGIPKDEIEMVKQSFIDTFKKVGMNEENFPRYLLELFGGEQMEFAEVKTKYQTEIAAMVQEAVTKAIEDQNEKSEIGSLKQQLSEKETENASLTEKVSILEKENDEFKTKEILAEKENAISAKIKESGLPTEVVTEVWMKTLRAAKEDEVDALIADRKSLYESVKNTETKVEGLGNTVTKKEISENKAYTVDDISNCF